MERRYPKDDTTEAVTTALTSGQVIEANAIGDARTRAAKIRGAKDRGGFNLVGEESRRGCRGELAAAKILGLPWNVPYSEDFRAIHSAPGDVGGYQVRTMAINPGSLIIRDGDTDDEAVFILACEEWVSDVCWVDLVGWAWCGDAKRPEHLRNPNGKNPAWFLPERFLYGIDTLPGGETR